MKIVKLIIITVFVLIYSVALAQDRNPSQYNIGLTYGIPIGSQTKSLNNNIVKVNLVREFSLGKIFSLNAKADIASTSGVQSNPNINKFGLGGGVKIQINPIVDWILKNYEEPKYNVYVSSDILLNINKISNYTNSGQMLHNNLQTGVELFNKKRNIYKIYIDSDDFIKDAFKDNSPQSEFRNFRSIGLAYCFTKK
jgi:hypothetical protein